MKSFSYNDFAYPKEHLNLDYSSRILEDSISPCGVRLTTFEVTFPRFILAEFNTHRVLSRNSASSRAIPPEKQIERLITAPFVPKFGTRVKGMGSGELNPNQLGCIDVWLEARDAAVLAARRLIDLGVDKARINRLLEPFMWHTVIATGTRWSNFFGLRTDKDAQPEFRIVAQMMQDEFESHSPNELKIGEWHLPLITEQERRENHIEILPAASAGRCARVSFDTHNNAEPLSSSVERCTGLTQSAHWSPTEHQAKVADPNTTPLFDMPKRNGNLHGDWIQFRKLFANESDWNLLMGSGNLTT